MVDTEKKFYPSPEDLTKFRTSVDVLIRRGVVREEVRDLLEFFQDGNTWGLPSDHVAVSRRVLKGFLEMPYLFPEDVKGILGVVKQEERFARVNWELRRKQVAVVSKRLSRLAVLTGLVIVGAFGAPSAISTVGDLYYQAFLSPEVIARQQEENLQKQTRENEDQLKKQQEVLQLEQFGTLGLDWTVESTSGWKFRYLPYDPAVEYQEVDYSGGSLAFGSGLSIYISKPPEERDIWSNNDTLDIYANIQQRLDKTKVPKLQIITPRGTPNIDMLLRTESSPEVDARVVHVYNAQTHKDRYLKITVIPGQTALQITQMTPVKRGA